MLSKTHLTLSCIILKMYKHTSEALNTTRFLKYVWPFFNTIFNIKVLTSRISRKYRFHSMWSIPLSVKNTGRSLYFFLNPVSTVNVSWEQFYRTSVNGFRDVIKTLSKICQTLRTGVQWDSAMFLQLGGTQF